MSDALERLLGVDPRRVAELRKPIGLGMAYAMARCTEPMLSDDSIHPHELAAAMLDADALGMASAIRAAGRLQVPATTEMLLEILARRVRSHLEGMPA